MKFRFFKSKTDRDKVNDALQVITDHLKVQRIAIVNGGPCIADPCGYIDKAASFCDGKNGFWFAVNSDGIIVSFGATLNGKEYKFPLTEKI